MSALVRRLALACAVVVAVACQLNTSGKSAGRRDAERLFVEALDHFARLDYARANQSAEEALRRDPGYLPAFTFLWSDFSFSNRFSVFLDSLAPNVRDPGVAACVRRAAAVTRGDETVHSAPPVYRSTEARFCDHFMRAFHEQPYGWPYERRRDSTSILLSAYPDWPPSAFEDARARVMQAPQHAVDAEVRRILRPRRHPIVRAYVISGIVEGLHERNRDSAAVELERSLPRDAAWRLPGFRYIWASLQTSHDDLRVVQTLRDPSLLLRHMNSVVAAADSVRLVMVDSGDQRARLLTRVVLGVRDLDRGKLEQAITLLRAAIPMVDSTGDAALRAYVRMRYGRAMVKAGRAPEAEQVLLAARVLGDSAGMPRIQKEIYHNLLHLYESLGQDSSAVAAGEAFVRYASMGMIDPVRMMSARDVALFLRARGRLDESRHYFMKMLADLDSLGNNANYAGEYYEMTGALDRAMVAYQKGATGQDDRLRAVGGLVRVALAMGDTAAARRWASIHDSRRDALGRPEGAPLVPLVLRRTVGGDAARAAFATARDEVLKHGQIAAWAQLTTDLAEFECDHARFDRAASLADSARDAAQRVGAAETALRARALAAFARVRHGGADAPAAMETLRVLALEADRSAGVLLRAEVRRLLGSARVARGNWRDGLGDYRRAVIPLDSVAGQIAMDPGQAAFRSAQRRAYDEALDAIVRNATEAGATAAFAAWSARRKGRSYAVQWPVESAGGIPATQPGRAIVDYVLLDSLVAALVVTSHGARIVRLHAMPRDIRAEVKALRSAVDLRVGSTLDIGRARYPLAIAHRLYRALIEPIEPHLASSRSIVIVPDGILALIPFDALVSSMPDDANNHRGATYVLDRYVVILGTTLWTGDEASQVKTGRVTMIDPGNAPDAPREIRRVTRKLPRGTVTLLQGTSANRRNAITAMQGADIVHFAAHARANEHDPGSSQIELAPEGTDDGQLGAAEVATLRLASPLVVLSACETANGMVLDGEGVLSMSRSFLRAGARATIATLWPVGPGVADFAEAFYGSVTDSRDAARSLRDAKLALRARGMPPTTWAPFQLFAAPAAPGLQPGTVAGGK